MSVSIVIPTYNRKQFSDLINHNINIQTYPLIKEILIADDGNDDERLIIDSKYSILYFKVSRMSIGTKRNFLKEKADGDYIVHMDTDDMYNKDYISNSIYNLIKSGKSITGSSDMLLYLNQKTYNQCCVYADLVNEATMIYKKSYSNTHFFNASSAGEGVGFVDIGMLFETPIRDIMLCLVHNQNTVNKKIWTTDKYLINFDLTMYKEHFKKINI